MSNGLNVLPSGSHPFHVSTPAEPIVIGSDAPPVGGEVAAPPMTSAWGVTFDATTGTWAWEPLEEVLGAGNDCVVHPDAQLTTVVVAAATSMTSANHRGATWPPPICTRRSAVGKGVIH